ncbi:hypothetical protein [Streptomyces uncialis]|uniref:hypothetical protein n=1 Tax=Streptomyces uncialis TaxID=1048205 RepID=UPI002F915E80|nr:hypothetical protein OG268_36980 [Streptomyces uncialis]
MAYPVQRIRPRPGIAASPTWPRAQVLLTWRPARPAEYIRTRLARQATAEHQAAEFEAAEGWDEDEAAGAFRASRPDLVANVLAGLA